MKTRLIVVAAAALFVMSLGLSAQAARQGIKGTKPAGDRVTKTAGDRQNNCIRQNQLGLTKDQMVKIRDIVKQFHNDVRGVIESSANREQKRSQVEALKTKASDAILAVLTPEQQTKAKESGWLDRVLSPRKHAMQNLGAILRQLNLTTEQKASVKTILQDSRSQAKAIKDDASLTKEQKIAKFVELRKATIEKIAAVLTPEQQTKFRELLAKAPQPGVGARRGRR